MHVSLSQLGPAISPATAADVAHVSRQTIYKLINDGVLTRYKIGRSTRLNTREVLALIGEGGTDEGS